MVSTCRWQTRRMARPRLIDRAAVLDAALALADEAGDLATVTMSAVARRLAVTAMALYRHVADKADLLDGLVELLVGEIATAVDTGDGDPLTRYGAATRAVARRHPAVFPLLLQRPAATPAAGALRDHLVERLVASGVAPAAAPQVERVVSTLLLGFATSEVTGRFAHHDAATLDADHRVLLDAARGVVDRGRP